jgi:hypothetical protein
MRSLKRALGVLVGVVVIQALLAAGWFATAYISWLLAAP